MGGYSGDAGDALMYEGDRDGSGWFGKYVHNGMMFSTFDQDNDLKPTVHRAAVIDCAWWYHHFMWACLTHAGVASVWRSMPGNDDFVVNSRMMVKPQK